MIPKIVLSSEPIGLVGGAPGAARVLERLKTVVQHVVAADGGAGALLAADWMPEAVIGDMDSLNASDREKLAPERLHLITEQDSTDFEKCMMRITAPVIVAAGFRGGRIDHELAALHGLMRFAEQRCVLLGQDDLVFLCPPKFRLDMQAGAAVSLFPLAPVVGRTSGLKWSFERLDYAPGGQIGTSNIATGPMEIDMSAPAMLCILPADCLGAVVKQLAALPGSWPARA